MFIQLLPELSLYTVNNWREIIIMNQNYDFSSDEYLKNNYIYKKIVFVKLKIKTVSAYQSNPLDPWSKYHYGQKRPDGAV